jgi:hypothetical protein
MVWCFPERLKVAEVILSELSREPLCHSVLSDKACLKGVSHGSFEAAFAFLVADGDVEKCGSAHRAPFRITEKGKQFLAWRGSK